MEQIMNIRKMERKIKNKYELKDNQKDEIIRALKKSEKEIERGEGIESDKAFKELRQKYGY